MRLLALRSASLVVLASCGGGAPETSAPTGPGAAPAHGAGTTQPASGRKQHAPIQVDASRCGEGQPGVRPIVASWSAADRAALAHHGEQSLALVTVSGCDVRLVSACKVGGTYRPHESRWPRTSFTAASLDDLYAKAPVAASVWGAELVDGPVAIEIAPSTVFSATAPSLHRTQLGAGCNEATHLVTSWAAGTARVTRDGASLADAEGIVALRLLPLREGAPTSDEEPLAAALTELPKEGTRKIGDADHARYVKAAKSWVMPLFQSCLTEFPIDWPATRERSVKLKPSVGFGKDGAAKDVTVEAGAGAPPALVECLRDAFHSARYLASEDTSSLAALMALGVELSSPR